MPSLIVLLRCYHLSRQYEWYCCRQLLHVNSSNCARMAGLMQNETGLAHFAWPASDRAALQLIVTASPVISNAVQESCM